MATELWTEKQTREVARQPSVRTDRRLLAAMEGLEVLTPELQTQVTDKRARAARRQQALTALHRKYAAIRSLPVCNIEGKTAWVDPAVDAVMKLSRSAWCTPKGLKVVDRKELAHVLVVQDAAKPGGRNQVVAHLRGCLVTTPDYFLSPPGSALQWKAALLAARVVYLSEAVVAAHRPMIDLILATAKNRVGSRWRTFVGEAEWDAFRELAAALRRKNELRTILHARESRDAKFRGVPSVMTLHGFVASLGNLDVSATTLGMCKR